MQVFSRLSTQVLYTEFQVLWEMSGTSELLISIIAIMFMVSSWHECASDVDPWAVLTWYSGSGTLSHLKMKCACSRCKTSPLNPPGDQSILWRQGWNSRAICWSISKHCKEGTGWQNLMRQKRHNSLKIWWSLTPKSDFIHSKNKWHSWSQWKFHCTKWLTERHGGVGSRAWRNKADFL